MTESNQALQAAREAVCETTRLMRLMTVLNDLDPLEFTLEKVLSTISELFLADIVVLLDPVGTGSFAPIAAIGLPEDIKNIPFSGEKDRYIGLLMSNQEPVLIQNAGADQKIDFQLRDLGAETVVELPVTGRDLIRGVLIIARCSFDPFVESDIGLLKNIADRIGQSLSELQRNVQLEKMVQAGHEINRRLDFDAITALAVNTFPEVINADAAALILRNARGELYCAAQSGLSVSCAGAIKQVADHLIASPLFKKDKPYITCNVSELAARLSLDSSSLKPVESLLAVPIYRENHLHGVIFGLRFASIPFNVATAQISMLYADQILAALKNSSLYRAVQKDLEDRQRAEELLSSFIEHSPIHAYIKEVTPTESRILKASENLAEMCAVPAAQLAGKTMQELFSAEFADKITADDWQVVSEGKVLRLDEDWNGCNYSTVKFPLQYGNKKFLAGYTINITARKQAEEALKQSEERYRMLVDLAIDGILLGSEDGYIIEVNRNFCEMTGLAKDELIGKPITALPITFITQQNNLAHVDIPEVEQAVLSEVTLTRPDTTEIFVEIRTRLMPDGTYQSIYRDITERSLVKAQLKESEEQHKSAYKMMRMLCDNVPDMIWAKDLEKRFLFANKAVCRNLLNAVDTDEPIGKKDMFFVERERALHADEPKWHTFGEICRDTDAITMDAGTPQQFDEYGNVFGKFLFLDVHKAPFLDESGKMIGTVGSARDVTRIKEIERKLLESEERLELALFGAGLAIWDWQLPSGAVTVDDRWTNMLGYAPGEIEQHIRSWKFLVHPDDLPLVVQALNKHRKGKTEFYEAEYRLRNKSGIWIWVRDKGRIIERTPQGLPLRACGTHLDITELKHAEDSHVKLQEQLNQARKMESIGRLAGGVAHDFNNMLSVILGYAQMALQETSPNSSVQSHLRRIMDASQRSANITRQLLAFARKQTISPKILNLNATIEQGMLQMLRRLLGENIELEWKPKANLWKVKIDTSQIDQILANLCVNARDAIDGIGKIIIETDKVTIEEQFSVNYPDSTPGEYVRLTISDNGRGMKQSILANIFEPFFTTKDIGKGTGLGLATVYGIVKQNQGFITVDSKIGLGTIFNIYLPRFKDTEEPDLEAGEFTPVKRGKETVLLVEDETIILEMATKMLQLQGYTVLAAAMPSRAIELVKNYTGQIHLLMTDVIMPEMNGRDLATQLQTLYPSLKLLFMSGYTSDIINDNGVLSEGVNFIQKPFLLEELITKVQEILE